MAPSTPPAPHRLLSEVVQPTGTTATDVVEAAIGTLTQETSSPEILPSSSGGGFTSSPIAFVFFAAIVFAFVFGLLVLTRLHPSQVLQIAGGTAAICVVGFFGRNAIVIIGRRLITGSGKQ